MTDSRPLSGRTQIPEGARCESEVYQAQAEYILLAKFRVLGGEQHFRRMTAYRRPSARRVLLLLSQRGLKFKNLKLDLLDFLENVEVCAKLLLSRDGSI